MSDDLTVEELLHFLSEHFGSPCEYTFDEHDVADVIPGEWCDANCRNGDYEHCWRKYFEIRKGEQDNE